MKPSTKSKQQRLQRKKIAPTVVKAAPAPIAMKPKAFVPAAYQDFNRYIAFAINRTNTHTHFILQDAKGLVVDKAPNEQFGRQYSQQLEQYTAKDVAARFLKYGEWVGMDHEVKTHLTQIAANGKAADTSVHIVDPTKPKRALPAGFVVKRIDRSITITWITKKNPRQQGSARHKRWAKYYGAKTVGEFLDRGGSLGDLRFDRKQGHLKTADKEAA